MGIVTSHKFSTVQLNSLFQEQEWDRGRNWNESKRKWNGGKGWRRDMEWQGKQTKKRNQGDENFPCPKEEKCERENEGEREEWEEREEWKGEEESWGIFGLLGNHPGDNN